MFLAIVTRPNIAYAVGVLSQVLDKPQQIHWTMVKRILRYLNGTKKRSTSGMVFKYNGGAIAWRSQRQSCIALSPTEAEFIAASQAAKEAIWTKHIDIRYKFIREQNENKQLNVINCSSKVQAADILTKPLAKDRILKL
ncbi:retrovirus-related Pol polyprotein from transposon TNT 1-94 [Trichonephila clavipes]|nr:retrovirus-related Pol polyprotein from transposon TNT 1-94 [Trichonephila clavipes]